MNSQNPCGDWTNNTFNVGNGDPIQKGHQAKWIVDNTLPFHPYKDPYVIPEQQIEKVIKDPKQELDEMIAEMRRQMDEKKRKENAQKAKEEHAEAVANGDVCEHDFVSATGKEDYPFKCGDCEELLDKHPLDVVVESESFDSKFQLSFDDFKKGMHTLGESAQQAKMSVEQFSSTCAKVFSANVPEVAHQHSVGSSTSFPVVTGIKPKRTSTPIDVDNYFALEATKIRPTGMAAGMRREQMIFARFPDLAHIDRTTSYDQNRTYILEFHDGSYQKVGVK